MIKSFQCKDTQKLFERTHVLKLPTSIQHRARRKLMMLHAATQLESLNIPPSNRLEKLRGNRAGQYSIRVNKQWRVCFCWEGGHAHDVEIVDYHR